MTVIVVAKAVKSFGRAGEINIISVTCTAALEASPKCHPSGMRTEF
jgi:hypothetical protein